MSANFYCKSFNINIPQQICHPILIFVSWESRKNKSNQYIYMSSVVVSPFLYDFEQEEEFEDAKEVIRIRKLKKILFKDTFHFMRYVKQKSIKLFSGKWCHS